MGLDTKSYWLTVKIPCDFDFDFENVRGWPSWFSCASRQPVKKWAEEDIVNISYQETTGEDTAEWKGLVHARVDCKMCVN
jgi:hypothetical protein